MFHPVRGARRAAAFSGRRGHRSGVDIAWGPSYLSTVPKVQPHPVNSIGSKAIPPATAGESRPFGRANI